jgi:DNA-binding NarL/FixJ family response regulator
MTENLKSTLDVRYALTAASEPDAPSGASPTPREIEIIQLLSEGKSNRQMATELGISVRTVEAHRAHIMRKLRARSVVELVYYAMDHGIARPR